MTKTVEIKQENCERCIHGYVCNMLQSLNPFLFDKVEEVKCMVFLDKDLVFEWKKIYDFSKQTITIIDGAANITEEQLKACGESFEKIKKLVEKSGGVIV